jgi:hypothetical protein
MLKERFSPENVGFVAIYELSRLKREPNEKLIDLLDRILKIGRRGKISESVMIGTAVRVLPKAVGLRLCEMGSKGTVVDWTSLYQYVRCAEPYLQVSDSIEEFSINEVSGVKAIKKSSNGRNGVKFVEPRRIGLTIAKILRV